MIGTGNKYEQKQITIFRNNGKLISASCTINKRVGHW